MKTARCWQQPAIQMQVHLSAEADPGVCAHACLQIVIGKHNLCSAASFIKKQKREKLKNNLEGEKKVHQQADTPFSEKTIFTSPITQQQIRRCSLSLVRVVITGTERQDFFSFFCHSCGQECVFLRMNKEKTATKEGHNCVGFEIRAKCKRQTCALT